MQVLSIYYIIVFILACTIPRDLWAQSDEKPLTSIRDVRSLSPEEAGNAYPLEVEGIVTFCWHDFKVMCYMQDANDGIFIRELYKAYEPGTYIRVSGHTVQGWFAPDIDAFPEVTVLGRRPLPQPSTLSPHYFYIGKEDARWVEIEGLVRSVNVHKSDNMVGIKLILDSYGNEVGVEVYHQAIPENLIGAFVKLQGVASGAFSPEMELIRLELRVPSIDFLEVITPGYSGKPGDVPLTSIRNVFTFSLDLAKNQYVRIQGTVILAPPGKDFLIKDDSGAMYIQADKTADVHLGDSVAVIGFPSIDNAYLRIEDAIVHEMGKSVMPPEPVRVDSVSHVAHSSLVTVTATLLGTAKIDSTTIYQLTREGYKFDAHLAARAEKEMRAGSIVDLTGIAELSYDPRYEKTPELDPFILHLRAPGDIVVLKPGPWWTATHTRWFATSLVFTVILAASWVALLRRKIDDQTREIRNAHLSLAVAYEESQVINNDLIETNRMLEHSMDQLHDALEANKEILGITAHDLKNPLGGIIGLAEMVIEDLEGGAQATYQSAADNLPLLQDEAKRMLQIIKNLLDKHREGGTTTLHKERILLNDISATVLRWNKKQATNKRIQLHFHAEEAFIVEVDVMSVQRILDNYVSNAIKYSPYNSNVWIELQVKKCAPRPEGIQHCVKVSVTDEGPGLTEEDKLHVFGKMQRLSAKPTGGEHSTGLGLFIVKTLVEAHGGEVGVDSRAGQGATFWFTLPQRSLESVPTGSQIEEIGLGIERLV